MDTATGKKSAKLILNIESEMTANTLFKSEEFLAYYSHMCPVNRISNKGELNGTILYLSSDASSYVTGQYIMVDGGLCIV